MITTVIIRIFSKYCSINELLLQSIYDYSIITSYFFKTFILYHQQRICFLSSLSFENVLLFDEFHRMKTFYRAIWTVHSHPYSSMVADFFFGESLNLSTL